MCKTVYIDQNTMENAIGIIFERETKVVCTGIEVHSEDSPALLADISRLCGLNFFQRSQEPEVPLYGVPYLQIFAEDGQGGWFAITGDWAKGPVYHIDQNLTPRLAAANRGELFAHMTQDPDWRRKLLYGDWPRLPEDPGGRKKLAEMLSIPSSEPETAPTSSELPWIFPSRTEAEKVFPIQDIWTILRDSKTPRFQVHPMMSPQDREGRALVHYQAWQETYSNLMPSSVLEAHTLERCWEALKGANSSNTFVALDREDGDRVIGFGTLSYFARDFVSVPEAGEIVALYVLQEFQGHGIGRELLERCLAWLPRPRAALFVLKGNDKAIGFYEHIGFRLTGHEVTQDGMTELEMVLEKSPAGT